MLPLTFRCLSLGLTVLLLGSCAKAQEIRQAGSPVSVQGRAKPTPANPNAAYYYLLSQLELKEGKIDEAIEDLKRAVSYEEKDPFLRVELATLYIHRGLLDEAVTECEAALASDPRNLSAYFLLGGIYSSQKKTQLAI